MPKPDSKPKPSGLVSTQAKAVFLVAALGLAIGAGLLTGSYAAGIMFLIIGFFAYRGLIQGLSGGIATLLALLISALIGPSLGRLISPMIESAFGITGLVARGVSLGLGGMIVFALAAALLRVVIRRALKGRELLKAADATVGALIGGAVGTAVAFVFAWVILALAPQGQTQGVTPPTKIPADRVASTPVNNAQAAPNPALDTIGAIATDLRGSSIGAAAQATLPGEESRVLSLASDFASVARDPAARQRLLSSQALKDIQNLPAAQQAADKARADPQLRHIIESGSLTPSDINLIAQSKTVTDILDTTDFLSQIKPLLPELEEAIRQAKAGMARPPD